MNKKGSIADAIYGPAKILGIAVVAFIAIFIWFSFADVFSGMGNNLTPAQNSSMQSAISNIQVGLLSFDYIFPFLIIGMLIVSTIFAFKSGANVVYAVLSLVIWVLALILSVVFTNIFGSFETSFPTVSSALPIVTYLMNNMKWLVLFWLALITIVMFTRNKKENEAISAAEMAFGGA